MSMRQDTLFDQLGDQPDRLTVRFRDDFDHWREAALGQLGDGCHPDQLHWQPELLLGAHSTILRRSDDSVIKVSGKFPGLARSVSVHRAADRWDFLYRCLWRFANGERYLLDLRADPLVRRLYRDAASVRRAVHKMHAFVRFRELEDEQGLRYVAWFEPDHPVVRHTAAFFRQRFANMRWSILTPELCAHWDGGGQVWFSEGASRDIGPVGDRFEEGWKRYYRSIFNPARLKTTAMQSEMPQKYWRNLPEAAEIQGLILRAGERVDSMLKAPSSGSRLNCGPLPASYGEKLEVDSRATGIDPLAAIALSLQSCHKCSLWEHATQPVPGEGPRSAEVMLIGEQPGDREDLAGKPFVGPAGQLLDHALEKAGLKREKLYMTNAVKHFRFRVSGKRRIHERPREREIDACNEWLMEEIGIVDPRVIICLGVTAASALFGGTPRLATLRGRDIEWRGRRVIVTIHPAAILRGTVTDARTMEGFIEDLRQVPMH